MFYQFILYVTISAMIMSQVFFSDSFYEGELFIFVKIVTV